MSWGDGMVPTSRVPSSSRRGISILATLGLVAGMLAGLATSAGAVSSCVAVNLDTSQVYTDSLQQAIDEAASGATLQITGTCVGNFTVSQDLTLQGRRTRTNPLPTLDGNLQGTVLTVSAGTVAIDGLSITRGSASGIYNAGTLSLSGSSSVKGNVAADVGIGVTTGGGIFNASVLTLNDSSSVSANTAEYGGGIYNQFPSGGLTLNDSSSVSGNTATGWGGGIYDDGPFAVMNDSSSVTGNTAGIGGGIVTFAYPDGFTLNDSSSVSWNSSGFGGGIFNVSTLTLNDTSSVFRNTAPPGGGVYNFQTVIMNDASSMTNNTASGGGAIFNIFGAVFMNDSSSIRGNKASNTGGGIANPDGEVTLSGSASIRQNTAVIGGGIDHDGFVYVCSGSAVQLSPNRPNDVPETTSIDC